MSPPGHSSHQIGNEGDIGMVRQQIRGSIAPTLPGQAQFPSVSAIKHPSPNTSHIRPYDRALSSVALDIGMKPPHVLKLK